MQEINGLRLLGLTVSAPVKVVLFIPRCVKNAKFAHKKSYSTICPRSLDSLCTVSYYMYKILLLWLDDY